jgi:hypothetical protein
VGAGDIRLEAHTQFEASVRDEVDDAPNMGHQSRRHEANGIPAGTSYEICQVEVASEAWRARTLRRHRIGAGAGARASALAASTIMRG